MTEKERLQEEMVNEFLIFISEVFEADITGYDDERRKLYLGRGKELLNFYAKKMYEVGRKRGRSESTREVCDKIHKIYMEMQDAMVISSLYEMSGKDSDDEEDVPDCVNL